MKKITEPMKIILQDAQRNTGIVRQLYPYGQMRLIISGLYRRGLIDDPNSPHKWELTKEGWECSV